MALDNQDAGDQQFGLQKTPQAGGSGNQKRFRNLILLAGGALAAGVIGMGIGVKYENLPATGSATRTDANVVAPLLIKETAPNGLSGSGFQIITGVTNDGTIFTKSGAIVLGPLASPNISMSGSNITLKGTLSGSLAPTFPLGGKNPYNAACYLSGGTLGKCVNATNATGDCNCTAL